MPAKLIQRNPQPYDKVAVDTVTIDIIESALRNARFEMDTVLFRTAMSPGIREQHDEFPMIANVEGKMVVGQFGSFIHGFLQGYDGTIEDGERSELGSLSAMLGHGGQDEPAGGAELRRQLKELNREFARAIRSGRADTGAWREAARKHLLEVARIKVVESNPKYLGGQA